MTCSAEWKMKKIKRGMFHEQMNHRISNDINQCASMSRTENEQTNDRLVDIRFDCHFSERCSLFLFHCVRLSRNVFWHRHSYNYSKHEPTQLWDAVHTAILMLYLLHQSNIIWFINGILSARIVFDRFPTCSYSSSPFLGPLFSPSLTSLVLWTTFKWIQSVEIFRTILLPLAAAWMHLHTCPYPDATIPTQ